ncbi:MAG: CPBP family intramembrane glutamic endopeptidase [Candidatus Hodarchaeota archaeon]
MDVTEIKEHENSLPTITSMANRLFRNNSTEIRLIWIFVVIPVYLVTAIVLNRLIFVLVRALFYIAEGYSPTLAFEQAQAQIMTLGSQVVLCTFDALLVVLLVFLLTKVEKRNFQWSTLGLALNSRNLCFFVLGLIFGFIFTYLTIGLGLILGLIQLQPLKPEEFFISANVEFLILFFIWAMLNGFWQELVFRGYLQTRVVERINATVGILTVTIYFVLIHFIDRQLTLPWILAGTLLFILISLLFYHTKSLYLVGAMHGMINYLDQVIELIGLEWISPVSVYRMKDIVILGVILGFYILISFLITKIRSRC